MRIAFLNLSLLCLTAPAPAFASGPGTAAANFLKIPVGARETALGGAFTAAADNSGAVFYNPAGLGLLETPELSFAYNRYLSEVSQQWFAAACPLRHGALGFGVNYLNAGSRPSYNSADNRTGSVSAYDMALYFSYGGRIKTGSPLVPSFLYGAGIKHISEKLDTRKASGYALDWGLMIMPGVKNLKLGLGFENLASSRIQFINEGSKLPFSFKTGVSYGIAPDSRVSSVLLSLDFIFPEDGPDYFAAGLENLLYGALALRAGYSSFGNISGGANFGFGFDLSAYTGRKIAVDYSFGSSYDFGNIHKFGVTYKFSRPGKAAGALEKLPEPALSRNLPADKQAAALSSEIPPARKGGESPFKLLLGMLNNENPEIVRDGINFLAGLNDPGVIDPFITLLYAENMEVRLAAVSGLARQNDERALKAIEGRLRDTEPEMRRHTAEVLGDRGKKSAGIALQEALKNEEDESVKSALIAALEKLNRGQ
ncbi:MAG: PorV/PorQ family protein [Elusimicrobia bacterium]|nr:PorV/PorQ family protein [Elusimicrobiota bacterium]